MATYIARRLLLVPVLLFGVTVLIFACCSSSHRSSVRPSTLRDFPRNDRVLHGIIKKYGLDQPLYVQYWRWLVGTTEPGHGRTQGGILFGDFGYSRVGFPASCRSDQHARSPTRWI